MSYDFKVLSQVDAVEEFPEGASVLIESQGNIKRCAADGLGGGGYVLEVLLEDDVLLDEGIVLVDDSTFAEAMDAYKSGSNVVLHLTLSMGDNDAQPSGVAGNAIEIPEEVHGYYSVGFMCEAFFDYLVFANLSDTNEGLVDHNMDSSEFTGPFGQFAFGWKNITLLTNHDFDYIMSFYGGEVEG